MVVRGVDSCRRGGGKTIRVAVWPTRRSRHEEPSTFMFAIVGHLLAKGDPTYSGMLLRRTGPLPGRPVLSLRQLALQAWAPSLNPHASPPAWVSTGVLPRRAGRYHIHGCAAAQAALIWENTPSGSASPSIPTLPRTARLHLRLLSGTPANKQAGLWDSPHAGPTVTTCSGAGAGQMVGGDAPRFQPAGSCRAIPLLGNLYFILASSRRARGCEGPYWAGTGVIHCHVAAAPPTRPTALSTWRKSAKIPSPAPALRASPSCAAISSTSYSYSCTHGVAT